jgi:mannose-6-phosphate isomerase-like protein (cupin superfamily)
LARTIAPTSSRPIKETPAHSSFDWHNDPEPQYVITLSGTLDFTTRDGETFILRPGDVLVAPRNLAEATLPGEPRSGHAQAGAAAH